MISTNKASIGRYEILGEIGRGAMGVVYKARDPQIDRTVAIKTISLFDLEPADDQEFRERFQQEARTAGRLSHPGIVAIFDVGSDPETNTPYIVMEYIAGSSLSKILLEDHGKLSLDPALQLVQEVAEALDYAHNEGVTHRDVKPANILLTPDGRAKLADFGIARLDQSQLTLPGRLLGSPAYMAPEQMKGEATDGRSDLFSLGVVLYRLSTGYRPFQGNSTATVCYKLLRQDPLPPSALNSELPFELDDFLGRAMAKEPEQRFQTGKEMALAIQSLRKNIATQQDPLAPLRRIIDRTGVSHAPVVPLEPVLEVPLPIAAAPAAPLAPLEPVVVSTTTELNPSAVVETPSVSAKAPAVASKAGKNPDPWMKYALVAASAVAVLGGILLGAAHRPGHSSPQAQRLEANKTLAQKRPASELIQNVARVPTSSSETSVPTTNRVIPKVPAINPDKPGVAAPKATRKKTRVAEPQQSEDSEAAPDQPIIVHNMDFAKLDVVIEHGFEQATVSVLVDKKPLYSQELHGESKRRALLFHKTQGKQSGTINLLPGKHDILVRVQSASDGYDATSSFSEGFSQGSKRVLLIKCDKRKNKLAAVIQ
jgi:serine/threonine protein kinase